ncbi:MAG: hypothetical protein H6710_02830 [Myxococcales bacterium]|nr:hypothetical protein [Myxococcales bacterium]MCB9704003.1 hypothetical protein [Myxococcales bacterium]
MTNPARVSMVLLLALSGVFSGACASGEADVVDGGLTAGDRTDQNDLPGSGADANDDADQDDGESDSDSAGVEPDGSDSGGDPDYPDRAPMPPGVDPPEPVPPPTSDAGFGEQTLCEKLEYAPCPADNDDSKLTHHEGLVPWAACRFELKDQKLWDDRALLLDSLSGSIPEIDVGDLAQDFDRLGTAITPEETSHLAKLEVFDRAFRWQDVDFNDAAWMPQGLSGTYDAFEDEAINGREMVAVSWYHNADISGLVDRDEIVRIAFADVTNIADGTVPYRHVLLVEPYDDGGKVNLKAPHLHAGGIAWVGRYLYVADTAKGLRVFDTSRIFEVSPDKDAIGYDAQTGKYHAYGYKYVLPQVGAYYLSGSSCWVRSSFVAVDNTSEPPSLITGEFHGTDIAGKLVRWPLDGEHLMATDPELGTTQASEIYFAQESDMQGALSINGEWWMSSSGQSGADGRLYRTKERTPSAGYGWVVGPEDLMYSRKDGVLWGLNEFAKKRFVFAVDISAYPAL